MPSLILDTGFETYRLTSSNSKWQAAPYVYSPLRIFIFIFTILSSFISELFHVICGKLDRGLKVERLSLSAHRMFDKISNLSLASSLVPEGYSGDENTVEKEYLRCSALELNSPHCSEETCLCKICRRKYLESSLFQTLLKLMNRFHSAKSSSGKHGLTSYTKQRCMLEFPTNEVNENLFEWNDKYCNIEKREVHDRECTLDLTTYEELVLRLAYLEDRVSCCTISSSTSRSFINWVDSSFGVFNQEMEENNSIIH